MSSQHSLSARAFDLFSCQAVVFTPDAAFSSSVILTRLFPAWSKLFDGEPVVLPLPESLPADVPRIILQNRSESWRCELSPARMSVHWRRIVAGGEATTLDAFFKTAVAALLEYQEVAQPRVGRLGAVIGRFARHPTPGLALSRHFCQERWFGAPLNRPEGFELHAHKRFQLSRWLMVNSWARNKSGQVTIDNEDGTAVLFEQDINTPPEEAPKTSYSKDDVARFFAEARREFDVILGLYYPEER